jgi:hypothetical protein
MDPSLQQFPVDQRLLAEVQGGMTPQGVPERPPPALMGQMGQMDPGSMPFPPPPGPGMAPPAPQTGPIAPEMAQMGQDPVLQQLLAQSQGLIQPKKVLPRLSTRFAKVAKPDAGVALGCVHLDREVWAPTVSRFARDLTLYRQMLQHGPPGFSSRTDVNFPSSQLSNVINKLTNMCGSLKMGVRVPDWDVPSRVRAQKVENYLRYCRAYEEKLYARGVSGQVQWDEFFYAFLYGRIVKRVLPDTTDGRYPYKVTLLDPSSVYPTLGDEKRHLLRLTRCYQSTVGEVIATYGQNDPTVEAKIRDKLGYDRDSLFEYLNTEMEVKEYWDPEYRGVWFGEVEVVPITAHGLGDIPFVYVLARGEPRSLATPVGYEPALRDQYDNIIGASGREWDLAEKGVSVFHHLVNTHRLSEVMHSLLVMEAIKAQNPPTITYSAPGQAGEQPPPLNTKPGGNNQRVLNLQKVEAIPTSPRPTDTAPVLSKIQMDWDMGAVSPHAFGVSDGSSNVSGFAIESMLTTTKDAVVPYLKCWETAQALTLEMKLRYYRDVISPLGVVEFPDPYGGGLTTLDPQDVEAVADMCLDVKLKGMSLQNLPGQIQAAAAAVSAGLWSQREGMTHIEVDDPDRMMSEIISERAIQHPEVMENYVIPTGFAKQGDVELAEVWIASVVMPKLMQTMGGMMTGQPPGAPAPPGAEAPPSPPEPNGQSGPMMNEQPPAPGGPAPGEGRGPSAP